MRPNSVLIFGMSDYAERQRMKRYAWILALGLMATPVLAQEQLSCEQQLQEALVRVQIAERDSSDARQRAAGDVVRWMNQARASENRLRAIAEGKPQKPSDPASDVKASPEGK